MLNLILFGPPGSGKGTQASKLVERYNLIHISTGNLFRHEISHNTSLGLEAKSYMDKGLLVPDEVTIGMLRNKVYEHPDVEGFIFDGYPRTIPQAEILNKMLSENQTTIHLLLSLEVDEDEIVKRLLLRGETSGRSDDMDADIIRKRFKVYKEETVQVFNFYNDLNKSVAVNGLGEIDDIFDRLVQAVDLYAHNLSV